MSYGSGRLDAMDRTLLPALSTSKNYIASSDFLGIGAIWSFTTAIDKSVVELVPHSKIVKAHTIFLVSDMYQSQQQRH